MLYVIPFVILLIVLVVVKKRQDAQGSDKSAASTATQKNKAKKTGSSVKVAPNKTQAVPSAVVEKKQTTELSADTRSKIESLIQERNFFSAEAQINQALKKDNSQHELYLYLLDIHILQKDEFAISQLLNHLRSLELDDILHQAESKKAEFEKAQHKAEETIAFISPSTAAAAEAPKVNTQQSNADFDALMAGNEPAPKADLAFEQLQAEPAPQPAVEEIKPLEFNLSFDTAPKAEAPEAPVAEASPAPSVDFGSFTLEQSAEAPTEQAPVAPQAPEKDIQPLDFSLDLNAASPASAQVQAEAPAQETAAPLDFSFAIDADPAKPAEETETDASPLSFDLSSLDAPAAAPLSEPEKPAAPSGVSFDISNVSSPATVADSSDPLIQSFPELAESNEITLNLELAQQYIKLGAYDAARELLAEKDSEYSAEERQQAEQLLNQIAS